VIGQTELALRCGNNLPAEQMFLPTITYQPGSARTAKSMETTSQTKADIAQSVANLHAWFQTMRQPGGYGGPVAHWWQNRFRYTGPGLDWRYEGLLIAYRTLYEKTRHACWRDCLNVAVADLIAGQAEDGSYRASRFEINPGYLGTPHEAAATFGLLSALPYVNDEACALETAKRNLDNLITLLWDGKGFNDRPKVTGRVPNKLATLAQALMTFAEVSHDPSYLSHAKAALEDVLRYQVKTGLLAGAIHQYAPGAGPGDGRFFPYYAARCVPPLLQGYEVFADSRYLEAARLTLEFIKNSMADDGSWPQIIYDSGQPASWPRWLAGAADILLAFRVLNEALPEVALERILSSQLKSGGFPTAYGFASQISQRVPGELADYRDVTPVVGWNDKLFRLVSDMLEVNGLPKANVSEVRQAITIWGQKGSFEETGRYIRMTLKERLIYQWNKQSPWAELSDSSLDVR
jgi:hypothetical protein